MEQAPQLSLLYTTFSTEEDAVRITRELLEKRLVACVNLLGTIKSLHFWEGRCEESREVAALLKTTEKKVPEVIQTLQDLHPYDTPAILEIPVGQGAELFSKWVQESVR